VELVDGTPPLFSFNPLRVGALYSGSSLLLSLFLLLSVQSVQSVGVSVHQGQCVSVSVCQCLSLRVVCSSFSLSLVSLPPSVSFLFSLFSCVYVAVSVCVSVCLCVSLCVSHILSHDRLPPPPHFRCDTQIPSMCTYTQALLLIGTGTATIDFEHPEEVPDELRAFVGRCLVRDPVNRATAEELLQDPFILSAPPDDALAHYIQRAHKALGVKPKQPRQV
jgi:serine/threonine protein kinase